MIFMQMFIKLKRVWESVFVLKSSGGFRWTVCRDLGCECP